jgi:hypothetical protein
VNYDFPHSSTSLFKIPYSRQRENRLSSEVKFSLPSDFSRRTHDFIVLTQSSGSIPSTTLEEQFVKAGLGWSESCDVAQSITSDSKQGIYSQIAYYCDTP